MLGCTADRAFYMLLNLVSSSWYISYTQVSNFIVSWYMFLNKLLKNKQKIRYDIIALEVVLIASLEEDFSMFPPFPAICNNGFAWLSYHCQTVNHRVHIPLCVCLCSVHHRRTLVAHDIIRYIPHNTILIILPSLSIILSKYKVIWILKKAEGRCITRSRFLSM